MRQSRRSYDSRARANPLSRPKLVARGLGYSSTLSFHRSALSLSRSLGTVRFLTRLPSLSLPQLRQFPSLRLASSRIDHSLARHVILFFTFCFFIRKRATGEFAESHGAPFILHARQSRGARITLRSARGAVLLFTVYIAAKDRDSPRRCARSLAARCVLKLKCICERSANSIGDLILWISSPSSPLCVLFNSTRVPNKGVRHGCRIDFRGRTICLYNGSEMKIEANDRDASA